MRVRVASIAAAFGYTRASQYSANSLAAGKAVVVNGCEYDVYVHNTPSAGGGHGEVHRILAPKARYEQHYTPLTNLNGWSIKLSKHSSLHNILQFEYTWHPISTPNTIWFDMSQVNGNTWENDYRISAMGMDCSPSQHAYRYATDDTYGMQSCPSDADIIVTLCSHASHTRGHITNARSTKSSIHARSGFAKTSTRSVSSSGMLSVSPMESVPVDNISAKNHSHHDPCGSTSVTRATNVVTAAPTIVSETVVVVEQVVVEDIVVGRRK